VSIRPLVRPTAHRCGCTPSAFRKYIQGRSPATRGVWIAGIRMAVVSWSVQRFSPTFDPGVNKGKNCSRTEAKRCGFSSLPCYRLLWPRDLVPRSRMGTSSGENGSDDSTLNTSVPSREISFVLLIFSLAPMVWVPNVIQVTRRCRSHIRPLSLVVTAVVGSHLIGERQRTPLSKVDIRVEITSSDLPC
jgi:hypothetical protein